MIGLDPALRIVPGSNHGGTVEISLRGVGARRYLARSSDPNSRHARHEIASGATYRLTPQLQLGSARAGVEPKDGTKRTAKPHLGVEPEPDSETVSASAATPEADLDFIPLPSTSRAKHEPSQRILDQIEAFEEGTESDSSSSASSHSRIASSSPRAPRDTLSARDAVAEANRAAAEHPHDTDKWLRLVHIQRQMVLEESSAGHLTGKSKDVDRIVAQAQLSILDVALRKMSEGQKGDSLVPLHLARMEIAAEGGVWDDSVTRSEWAHLVPLHPPAAAKEDENEESRQGTRLGLGQGENWNEVPTTYAQCSVLGQSDLWQAYLSSLSCSSAWRLTDVLDMHALALKWLLRKPLLDDLYQQAIVPLLVGVAEVLKAAGYIERGFALLQAQLCLSPLLGAWGTSGFRRAKELWADLWDGEEEARWGEPWSQLSGEVTPVVGNHDKPAMPCMSQSISQLTQGTWMDREWALTLCFSCPRRSADPPMRALGEVEVDPHSVVLWSDLDPYLLPLTSFGAVEKVRQALYSYTLCPMVPGLDPPLIWHNAHEVLLDPHVQNQTFWPTGLVAAAYPSTDLGPGLGSVWDMDSTLRLDTREGEALGDRLLFPFSCPIATATPREPMAWAPAILHPGMESGFSLLPSSWGESTAYISKLLGQEPGQETNSVPNRTQLWQGFNRASVQDGLALPRTRNLADFCAAMSVVLLSTRAERLPRVLKQVGKRFVTLDSADSDIWSMYALAASRCLAQTEPQSGIKALVACLSQPELANPGPSETKLGRAVGYGSLWVQLAMQLACLDDFEAARAVLHLVRTCAGGPAPPNGLDWISSGARAGPSSASSPPSEHPLPVPEGKRFESKEGPCRSRSPSPTSHSFAHAGSFGAGLRLVTQAVEGYCFSHRSSDVRTRVQPLLDALDQAQDLPREEAERVRSQLGTWVYTLSYQHGAPRKFSEGSLPPALVHLVVGHATPPGSQACLPLLWALEQGVQRLHGQGAQRRDQLLDLDVRRSRGQGQRPSDGAFRFTKQEGREEKEHAHLLRIYHIANQGRGTGAEAAVQDACARAVGEVRGSGVLWALYLHHQTLLLLSQPGAPRGAHRRALYRRERHAGDVAHRALAACPGHKGVWLLALQLLRQAGQDAQLLGPLAEQRELRFFLPLADAARAPER